MVSRANAWARWGSTDTSVSSGFVWPVGFSWNTIILDNLKSEVCVSSSAVAGVVVCMERIGALKNELFRQVVFLLAFELHPTFVKTDTCEGPAGTALTLVLDRAGL